MTNSDSMNWSQVAAKGAGLKVLTRARNLDAQSTLSSETLYEHPDYQDQQLARKAAAIVRQALTPNSVLFSFPPTTFTHRTEAYDAIAKDIGPLAAVRPLSLYSTHARGDLLIEAKFQSPDHAKLAINNGITVDGIVHKASPSVQGVEKPLIRVQLNLLHMATGDELKDGLLSSLRFYGKVYQIRQILCNGYFEGQLTITLDPSHGYEDEKGEIQDSQPLQRMLYLEKWDLFAPASFKGAAPICYYCRQAGHIRSTCPELAKRRCFGCGETGHTKRFCKIKVPQPQPAGTESETELLDRYLQDSCTDEAIENSSQEDTVNDTAMEEAKTSVEDQDASEEQDFERDMDVTEEEQVESTTEVRDPNTSILASKHAPYDKAINMKVDDPKEMLSISTVKETTRAKSEMIKRTLVKRPKSFHNDTMKISQAAIMKPVVPKPTNKLSSSARRAQ